MQLCFSHQRKICPGERLGIQLVHQLPVAVAQTVALVAVHEQRAQLLQKILAVTLPVRLQHHRRVRRLIAEILRLVGKEAHQHAAKLILEALIVLLVRFLDEFLHDFRIENVHNGAVRAVVQADAAFALVPPYANEVPLLQTIARQRHGIERRPGFAGEIVREIGAVLQQLHAGEAARPAVLIIRPCVHALLFGFVDTSVNGLEPVLAHILGQKAAARVHEKAADTRLLHLANLPAQLLRLQLVVPAPERYGLVFREIPLKSFDQVHIVSPRLRLYWV